MVVFNFAAVSVFALGVGSVSLALVQTQAHNRAQAQVPVYAHTQVQAQVPTHAHTKAHAQLSPNRQSSSPPSALAKYDTKGKIEKVQLNTDGSASLTGWACALTHPDPISVHLYLGAAAGKGGEYISEQKADLASGADVAKACQSKGTAYRFHILLSPELVFKKAGQKIFVHGINPMGRPNKVLVNSGTLKVPTPSVTKLSWIAQSGSDLLIPQGKSVIIDTSVDIGKLTINGKLTCPETGDFTIRTTGILVSGSGSELLCGSETARFQGRLVMAIKGGLFERVHGAMASDRNVLVMNGGTLRLMGGLSRASWLRLAAHAAVGTDRLELGAPVDWRAGDEVVIAPSNYNAAEAERVEVAEVINSGRTVLLKTPLRFFHWGELQSFQGQKTWQVDERAEVANLSRNIVIRSEGDVGAMDSRGAHVMVMAGAFAYIDGVEFFRMGRMGEMARYPFHWHRAGNVKGQFIRNSSIHESFQRCITVHGTMQAQVVNNVCFDHFGHGLFLEDGNETDNIITGNLVILSKRPPRGRHLLQSDIQDHSSSRDRFPGPASYWISNPQNTVKDNVAAGSQGTGFWMSFSSAIACDAKRFCQKPDANHPATVFPATTNFTEFSGNMAHSMDVGMTWDGVPDGELTNNPNNDQDRLLTVVHYGPPQAPQYSKLAIHKTKQAGIYYRGTTAYFSHLVMADNKVSLFFSYNQVAIDSAIVAQTANHTPSDYQHNSTFTGINVYDGPFDLRNIDFLNFASQPILYRDTTKPSGEQERIIVQTPLSYVGGTDRFANVVQGLVFNPEPVRRIDLSHDRPDDSSGLKFIWWTAESDSQSSPGVRDLDGSLTGRSNSIVVPNHPFMHHSGCTPIADGRALNCDHQWGGFLFFSIRNGRWFDTVPMVITRNDGVKSQAQFDELDFSNLKFGVILGKSFDQYDVHFAPQWSMPGKNASELYDSNSFKINFKSEVMNQMSPVLGLHGLGQECFVKSFESNEWKRSSSLEALRSSAVNSYFSLGTDLYIRFLSSETAESTGYASSYAKQGRSRYALINCTLQ